MRQSADFDDFEEITMPPSFPPESEVQDNSTEHKEANFRDIESHDDDELEQACEPDTTAKKRSVWRSIREFTIVVVVALVISALIKTFFIQAFYVPSSSMETTLKPGDRIAVNRLVNSAEEIHRGDVVVFVDPGHWLDKHDDRSTWRRMVQGALETVGLLPQNSGHHLVKRVIGVGGDTVACCTSNGKITVNGTEITEPYLDEGVSPSLKEFSVRVPQGSLWVMGDNRANSSDSRYHEEISGNGFVPVDNVVGRAWAIFYPFSRLSMLESAADAFADVR